MITVTVETASAEAAEFALNESGALGTSLSLLARADSPLVSVKGYFEKAPEADVIEARLKEALRIYGFEESAIKKIALDTVEDQDWLAEWKKFWKPTVTGRYIIAAPWEEIDDDRRTIIRIEPGMAFGTGTHETTRLCMREIEELFLPEMSFLDVGTGTGVLAIAASKLSAGGDIEACDVDADAVAIAEENARLNDCQEIRFETGTITESSRHFDFICANLTTDVLLPILPILSDKARKVLVMSGILAERRSEITVELERLGFSEPEVRTDCEWASVTVQKQTD